MRRPAVFDCTRHGDTAAAQTALPTTANMAPRVHAEMIIWGGYDGTQTLSDGARYRP